MASDSNNMDVSQAVATQTVVVDSAMATGHSSIMVPTLAKVPNHVTSQPVATIPVNHGEKSEKSKGLNF